MAVILLDLLATGNGVILQASCITLSIAYYRCQPNPLKGPAGTRLTARSRRLCRHCWQFYFDRLLGASH
jgi:hypothetical protein